jgi:hypothetical protein
LVTAMLSGPNLQGNEHGAKTGIKDKKGGDLVRSFLPAARRPGLNRGPRKVGLTSVATGRCAGVGEEGRAGSSATKKRMVARVEEAEAGPAPPSHGRLRLHGDRSTPERRLHPRFSVVAQHLEQHPRVDSGLHDTTTAPWRPPLCSESGSPFPSSPFFSFHLLVTATSSSRMDGDDTHGPTRLHGATALASPPLLLPPFPSPPLIWCGGGLGLGNSLSSGG